MQKKIFFGVQWEILAPPFFGRIGLHRHIQPLLKTGLGVASSDEQEATAQLHTVLGTYENGATIKCFQINILKYKPKQR